MNERSSKRMPELISYCRPHVRRESSTIAHSTKKYSNSILLYIHYYVIKYDYNIIIIQVSGYLMHTWVISLWNEGYLRFGNKLNKSMNIIISLVLPITYYYYYVIHNILNIMHILYTSIVRGK